MRFKEICEGILLFRIKYKKKPQYFITRRGR